LTVVVSTEPRARGALLFSIPSTSHVTLTLFDVRGRAVRKLVDQDAAAGTFEARWDGRDDSGARAARGVYFARFMLDGKVVESRKLSLVQ
jgi:flagellar hook assembly protein FlgD